MTPQEQADYWRKYSKQNAKMERMAYKAALSAMMVGMRRILASIDSIGVDDTLLRVDGLFDVTLMQDAYEKLYYEIGVAHKKWTDRDVKERILKKKEDEEDDRIRRRPNPLTTPAGVEGSFGVGFYNPMWLAKLKQIVNSFDVAQRITSVTDTIRERIKKSIQDSQQKYVTISKIKAALKRDLPAMFRKRAETIARTEVTYINNIAAEQSAYETGLKLKKVWIHTRDDRTRDAHRNVPMKPINADDKFMVGGVPMTKPGDPAGGLKNVVNCRCSVAYLPADDYADLLDSNGNFTGF